MKIKPSKLTDDVRRCHHKCLEHPANEAALVMMGTKTCTDWVSIHSDQGICEPWVRELAQASSDLRYEVVRSSGGTVEGVLLAANRIYSLLHDDEIEVE